jgi:hypothetical protein
MVLHLLTDYSLDTLHTVGDEEEPDSTTVLLSKIHESQQKASYVCPELNRGIHLTLNEFQAEAQIFTGEGEWWV